MNTKYIDLIQQTFDFPNEEFTLDKDALKFHDIDLNALWKRMEHHWNSPIYPRFPTILKE